MGIRHILGRYAKWGLIFGLFVQSSPAWCTPTQVVCGDHWLTLDVRLSANQLALVRLYGDSGIQRESIGELTVTVVDRGLEYLIPLTDAEGGLVRLYNDLDYQDWTATVQLSKGGRVLAVPFCREFR